MIDGRPAFSIIMPVYKCSGTILESVSSVLNQTFRNFELLVIDDCCPQGSTSRLDVYDDPRIHIYKLEINGGVAAARNFAISKARGSYIAFLDADDVWKEKKLELQYDLLSSNELVVCSYYYRFSPNEYSVVTCDSKIDYYALLKSNKIGNLTGVYNCDILGKFYQENCGHEDYLMWLNVVKKAGYARVVPQVLAGYRVVGGSLSSNKFRAAKWQWYIYRNKIGLSFFKSSWFFAHYIINSLLKRWKARCFSLKD
ncbi:glycosyltransferase family 2 protein [Halomonas sp. DP5Y7-2]|uniref:glycosyltransferase family 2 protein n=1 Tax=Halomonas sp. DP5Y7-2 TaxID=2859076 RepID=UPI001C994588|nr:glycosyltransferase family 2 protein [Halomonas sp. DP5Y7-2]MBY5985173.1 glycosyltransferase family 2 protein [Halomonas sp. DP5Y7-2]